MNGTECLAKKIGFVLCMALLGALTGHTTYAMISTVVSRNPQCDMPSKNNGASLVN
jgi:hypothetical protein